MKTRFSRFDLKQPVEDSQSRATWKTFNTSVCRTLIGQLEQRMFVLVAVAKEQVWKWVLYEIKRNKLWRREETGWSSLTKSRVTHPNSFESDVVSRPSHQRRSPSSLQLKRKSKVACTLTILRMLMTTPCRPSIKLRWSVWPTWQGLICSLLPSMPPHHSSTINRKRTQISRSKILARYKQWRL